MTNTSYFGGVEGGGTHSTLIICDGRGKVLGQSKGPHTNHWSIGIEECARRIVEMLHTAKDASGIPRDTPLDALGLTLSGCEQDSTNAQLGSRVREQDPDSAKAVFVASDTVGSLFTGAPKGGLVLIAGTGSNALLLTADGKEMGCGGWGHVICDEGGAYWIAMKTIKTIFEHDDLIRRSAHDPEPAWEVVKDFFQLTSKADFLPHAYAHFDKSRIAGVTLRLAKLASAGDAFVRHVFAQSGAALGAHVAALAARARLGSEASCRVVCVGSVWLSWDLLRPGFEYELRKRGVQTELELVRTKVSSAMGACWLAARHVGRDLPRDDDQHCTALFTFLPLSSDLLDGGCGCDRWTF